MLFGDELRRLGARPGIEVEVTVDRAGTAWAGRVGLVTELLPRARFDPATHARAASAGRR